MGKKIYAQAQEILINADGGGSNGSRVRLWKIALQELVDEIGIPITVCHYPPRTSKWNAIEHKMFAHISTHWRGKPLRTFNDVVQYIRATTTQSGLSIDADIDPNTYEKGIKVSNKALRAVNIKRHDFHGEWNYTISPSLAA